jgi:tetratricopeptide (TPR) repeat protein
MALGAADRAVPLLERAVELNRKQFGADNPNTFQCICGLAAACVESGQVERGIRLYEEALERRRAKLDSPETLRCMHNLASAYKTAKRHDQSIPLFDEAFRHRRQLSGPDHPETLLIALGLGSNLVAVGSFERAEAMLRENVALAANKHPTAWFTSHMRCVLGASLVGQGKYADAEPLLVQGYEGLKERAGKMPKARANRVRVEAVESLIRLYDALQSPDEAAKWKRELETLREAAVKP